MPSKPVRKSTCQKARRNSPSVTPSRPAASCSATARRISRSSTAFRFCAVILPFLKSWRAFFSSWGRNRLPTWSARKGTPMGGSLPWEGPQRHVPAPLARDRHAPTASLDAATEERQSESGTEPPSRVDDRADHHRRRHEARGGGLSLERRDDEPRDQGRKQRAEEERGAHQRDPLETAHRDRERDAPDAAPERERPDLRNA